MPKKRLDPVTLRRLRYLENTLEHLENRKLQIEGTGNVVRNTWPLAGDERQHRFAEVWMAQAVEAINSLHLMAQTEWESIAPPNWDGTDDYEWEGGDER